MIWESSYWKNELHRASKFLNKKSQQKKWSPTDSFQIEKTLFVSAFIIRKLLEAKTKLSDAVEALNIQAETYSQKDTTCPDLSNWHNLDRFYNLDESREISLSLNEMCNRFIHSYIFMVCCSENGQALESIYVNSDYNIKRPEYTEDNIVEHLENVKAYKNSDYKLTLSEKNVLFFINVKELICILDFISEDNIVQTSSVRGKNGEWKSIKKVDAKTIGKNGILFVEGETKLPFM